MIQIKGELTVDKLAAFKALHALKVKVDTLSLVSVIEDCVIRYVIAGFKSTVTLVSNSYYIADNECIVCHTGQAGGLFSNTIGVNSDISQCVVNCTEGNGAVGKVLLGLDFIPDFRIRSGLQFFQNKAELICLQNTTRQSFRY